MFCRRKAPPLPKQILHFFFGKTFYRSKGIDNLKHAAFDCVSIRARTESQSNQENLFGCDDGDGERSFDG
jgi:hypothetical protein